MRDDLGIGEGGVHGHAEAVLRFWFDETSPASHFGKDEAFDRVITTRFGPLLDFVITTKAVGWDATPHTILAAIVLLDQFSRNIHRGDPKAFVADPLARELTNAAMRQGWDHHLSTTERVFLYMPLMHTEDRTIQRISVASFEALGEASNLKYARSHADVIDRFGRFPSRNETLGRDSTAEECIYLSRLDADW